ncbi:MAG: HYR domain-containing protein [Deltaproteobacteria bacterium]|nr:MAG: HYR domain-containing protein [Deltaproteobacteria bacterium]
MIPNRSLVSRCSLSACHAALTLAAIAACSPPSAPPPPAREVLRMQSLSGATSDSRGTEFWLMFTGNFTTVPQLSLFIAGDVATAGSVTIPGLAFSSSFSVTPGVVTTVTLPSNAEISTSDTVENKAIHVTAGAEVSVYGLNRIQFTTDAFLGLPTDIAGTDYVVLGFPNVNVVNGTEFGFAATQDDTVVTVTPHVTTGAHPAGVPYDVHLGLGQAYQLRNTNVAPADLTGTIVTSTKPIALFGGHECANIPDGGTLACDYIVEQLPSTDTWGRNFVTVPLATRLRGDTFRILAATDGTTVSVAGAPVAVLNRGQVHQRLITGASTITADKPVLVAQYSNGTTFDNVTSDPFMMLVPPHEQFLASYTVLTPTSGFPINFINLAAPAGAVGAIKLDGVVIPAAQFTAIGASGFDAAQLSVSVGSHNLTGPLPFGVFVYGFASADSYGYPGGMSLSPVAIVTSITLAPKTGSDHTGNSHCVTATVTDQNAGPVSGVRVDFAVTGANSTAGFSNTDGLGQAQFCYVGTSGGTDHIVATISNLSDDASFLWISNAPPVARCADRTVAADSVCAAAASIDNGSFDPDGNLVGCTQDPPSPYTGVGPHSVTLTCTDTEGETSSCTATVTVTDATPPTIACPADELINTPTDSAIVTYPAPVAGDNCGTTGVTCSIPSGTTEPLGTYTITCSTSDGSENTASCSFRVHVNAPPDAICSDIMVAADASCHGDGSINNGSVDRDGDAFTCVQAPPPPYALGDNPATLTCTDEHGTRNSCSATIDVVDRTPPAIVCPGNQTLECVDHGAVASFTASATDNCSVVDPTCTPPSGSSFPVGTTDATCSASDGSGNAASCAFTVTVIDTHPPVVTTSSVTLWPPDHKYSAFDVADCLTRVVDACDGQITVASAHITRITSDEAEDDKLSGGGLGDGNTCDDIVITGPHSANLRAERMGHGNGRAYTVFFDVTDAQGNVTSTSCQVGVPHDQSDPTSFPDDGCRFCVGTGCGSCPGHDAACTF